MLGRVGSFIETASKKRNPSQKRNPQPKARTAALFKTKKNINLKSTTYD